MRICIDLDGTICETKQDHETYADVLPIKGAVETLHKFKRDGHYIIIYTARHMKTCDGNLSKIIARIGKVTLDWLEKHNVPYDEICFGKPYADIYIDDKSIQHHSWEDTERIYDLHYGSNWRPSER